MCGIAGSFELGRETSAATLDRMIRTVGHRGPDGVRVEVDGPAGLAHARLRVIDLSPQADQPIWNESHSVGVFFNGEIYNFRELRSELQQDGIDFHTQSDTEVILRLYEKRGRAAVPKLDGMFSLAVWDRSKGQLLLARDRAGKKPLYYYKDSKQFLFASEIKALLEHPAVARRPNLDGIPYYLTFGYFPAPMSPYDAVQVLPPASLMTITEGGEISQERYWVPPFGTNGVRSVAEAVDGVRDRLTSAVAKRLVSDVPLGSFLSGGIDSTIIVGLMSRQMNTPVRTFSIGFEDAPEFDETRYAEEVAKSFRTEHTTFRVRPPEGELLEKLVHHHDGPFGDSSAIPTYIVSQLAREHVTVVLNGDGGDELFAGYSRLAAAALTERVPRFLRQGASWLSKLLPEPSDWSHPFRRYKRLLQAAPLPLDERIQTWCTFFPQASERWLQDGNTTTDERVKHYFRHLLDQATPATPLSRLLFLNFCTYLPEDLLVKMDRSTMAHGLEARSPFLDTALIEFVGGLPDHFKLRGLQTKYILRKTFDDLIPPAILGRPKMGFGAPLGAWFRGPMRPFVESHLGSSDSRIFELLRRDPVKDCLQAHMDGHRDAGHQLFCLLTLEIWLRSL